MAGFYSSIIFSNNYFFGFHPIIEKIFSCDDKQMFNYSPLDITTYLLRECNLNIILQW